MNTAVNLIVLQGENVRAGDSGYFGNLLGEWSAALDVEEGGVVVGHRRNLNLPDPTSRSAADLPEIRSEV